MAQESNQTPRIEATVISSTGSWYEVATAEGRLNCRIRGRLRLKGVRSTNPVVVGDRVMVEPDGDNSAIVEILPRRNYVIRRASNLSKESHIIAANIDRALLLITLHSPTTPREFVDRFLVTCEAYKVPVTIVIGKADTLENEALEEADEFTAIYEDAGYEVMRLSSVTGEGVDDIRAMLRDHTPENKAGMFQGLRIVGQVLIPGIIGPVIGSAVLKNAELYTNDDGTKSFIPNVNIFLAAAVVAVLVFVTLIPILNLKKGESNREE